MVQGLIIYSHEIQTQNRISLIDDPTINDAMIQKEQKTFKGS